MNHTILSLLLALAINELIHNLSELWGINQKVEWLAARMDGRPHNKWPIHIDTKLKVVMLHALMLAVCTGVSWLIIFWLGLSAIAIVWSAIITLLASYALTTAYVDSYHTRIGRLLERFKQ